MSRLTYSETLDRLYALEARKGMDFRLERLDPVLEKLDRPERAFPSIHVAGTNGKGSTAAMLHSVYVEGGYRAGLYTSPHLFSFCERIRTGHRTITEDNVVLQVERVRRASEAVGERLTFFEIATIAAFLEFRDARVDLAVIEAGLGGRLDATNVLRSAACVITGVALDHCEFLGNTVAEVAAEKAGIVRESVPVIVGPVPPDARAEIAARCEATGARLIDAGAADAAGLRAGLRGAHQQANAGVALRTVAALESDFPVDRSAVERGISGVDWPGRFEALREANPVVLVDSAHNPDAAAVLVETLAEARVPRPSALVFGAMADKDWAQMLEILAPAVDRMYLVPVDSPRSYAPSEAGAALPADRVVVCESAESGLRQALAWCDGRGSVVVTGSIFLVAELYESCARAGRGDFHAVRR